MRRVAAAVLACLLLSACGRVADVRVDVGDLERRGRPNQSVVLAADGTRIATLRVANRTDVGWDDLPRVLVDAVVAAEDRSFFDHGGVNLRAIARAALANQRAGRIVEGGSTITQQLARFRWLPEAEDELGRKVVEAHLARRLEAELTKPEILLEYLNSVYFGAGAHGIGAAARTYFDLDVADLALHEAALLAGLIRSPESASPYTEPEAATALRGRVLQAMVQTGAITAAEAAAADARPLGVGAPPEAPGTRYPWFVEQVKRSLLDDPTFGRTEAERLARLYGAGLEIHTTIRPDLQDRVAAAADVFSGDDPHVAAAVVDPHTGHLVAAVSGRDFTTRPFDLAVQARRQPGSTFKTFALAAAFEEGWRPDDTVDSGGATFTLPDADGTDRGARWRVRSFDAGPLALEDATASSSNGVFARLALQLGGDRVVEQARRMGISSTLSRNPSIVLGGLRRGVSPLEMASAYGTLATGGVHVPVSVVTRINHADGTVAWRPDVRPRVATDAATAWLTTRALRRVVTDGTGVAADIGRPAAGKTGTVERNTDAWFVGYTADLTAAVWVGHPDGLVPMRGVRGVPRVTGGDWPARIWADIMRTAHADVPVRDFPYPDELTVTVLVDPESGQLATDWCPDPVEVTGLPAEVPEVRCRLHGPPPATRTVPTDEPAQAEPTPDAAPSRAPDRPVTDTAGLP